MTAVVVNVPAVAKEFFPHIFKPLRDNLVLELMELELKKRLKESQTFSKTLKGVNQMVA